MPRSEWTRAFAFERVQCARGSQTPVDNPPSVEAVLYRWRAGTGWDRLTYRQYWSSLVCRVKFSCRSFSCRSIITHEYVIAFVNEVLYRRATWDRYVAWHWAHLREAGWAKWQISYFKWYSRAEWEAERRGLLLWPHSS